jgi:predicted amidophosphoribosyltransferase
MPLSLPCLLFDVCGGHTDRLNGLCPECQRKENEMSTANRIKELKHEAQNCNDARRLREIEGDLTYYGQWDEARKVGNKAFELEKKQSEEVR